MVVHPKSRVGVCLLTVGLLISGSVSAIAQRSGQITGTVPDSSGAVIRNVTVTAFSVATQNNLATPG